jgi:hypothetical protein
MENNLSDQKYNPNRYHAGDTFNQHEDRRQELLKPITQEAKDAARERLANIIKDAQEEVYE